jgi:hypothetical protein
MPPGHSATAAWPLRLVLDNGSSVELSSACTVVSGWTEVGSLNLKLIGPEGVDEHADLFTAIPVDGFWIADVVCVVHEDEQVHSESGLALTSVSGEEIQVVAGVSPGSVSMRAPFVSEPFEPEFAADSYSRKPLT